MIQLLIILSLFYMTACSKSPGNEPKDTKQRETSGRLDAFGPFENWPERASMRRVGDSFGERITHVKQDSSGNTWILRKARREDWSTSKFIEKYDSLGALLLSLPEPKDVHFNAFTVHPSGEVTVAETRKINTLETTGTIYHIWFKRLRSDGSILTEAPLRSSSSEKEQLYYKFDWSKMHSNITGIEKFFYEIDEGDKVRLFSQNHEALLSVGEEAIFLAWTFGVKLYQIDNRLHTVWNQQVMPLHGHMTNMACQEKLAVDENGHLYVAIDANTETLEAWKTHFNQAILREENADNFLILHYDSKGTFQNANLFREQHYVSVAGFAVKNNVMTLGGTTRINGKLALPNNTWERDLIFLKANLQTDQVLLRKTINLKRDDHARDFKLDHSGNGVFVGTNNYVQVDTNSIVESGQAFILKLDTNGNQIDYIELPGPRDTEITSFDFLKPEEGDYGIVFGGEYDSPITHTGDQDKSQNYSKGMLGIHK